MPPKEAQSQAPWPWSTAASLSRPASFLANPDGPPSVCKPASAGPQALADASPQTLTANKLGRHRTVTCSLYYSIAMEVSDHWQSGQKEAQQNMRVGIDGIDGINNIGRIGRQTLRAALGAADRPTDDPRAGNRFDVVHLNELKGGTAATAHLLEFDSVQGHRKADVTATGDGNIRVADKALAFSSHATAAQIPWGDLGVDMVLECTGKFLTPESLQGHLDRGAKRLIVAAPVKVGDVLNTVGSINHGMYGPARHPNVTVASCTTNCLAPGVKVVHEALGIRHGQITTGHDPTNTRLINAKLRVDAPHKDLRRARTAMLSLAAKTTVSATDIALICPELKSKLNGHAVRTGAERLARQRRLRTAARDHGGSSQPAFRRSCQGPAWGHPRRRGAPARQRRLCGRHPPRDRRCAGHPAVGSAQPMGQAAFLAQRLGRDVAHLLVHHLGAAHRPEPLMEGKTAVALLAALAQGMRLRSFRALVGAGPQGLAPGVLSITLDVPASPLSFHLKALTHSGLVTQERDGRHLIDRPALGQMNALMAYLTAHCCEGVEGGSCELSPPACTTC